jgi:ribosomal-protein-alanine N-acetyltransferase
MESANLIIKETIFTDCCFFAKWEVQEYIRDCFTMSCDRGYEEIVREYVVRSLDKDKLQYTIVHREEEKPIGRIYLSKIDKIADSLDITRIYIGEKDYMGRGFGEEAMRLLLEYCYIQLHTERVTLDHLVEDKGIGDFYKKLGFQYEGIMRNAGKKNGRYVDLHLMSMLRSEYFEKYRTVI